jgi:hypothetical protein
MSHGHLLPWQWAETVLDLHASFQYWEEEQWVYLPSEGLLSQLGPNNVAINLTRYDKLFMSSKTGLSAVFKYKYKIRTAHGTDSLTNKNGRHR